MNILSRAWQGLNLTPGERAFLKLLEGWIFTAVGTGVAIAYQMLATGNQDFQKITLVAGGAAGLTVLNALKKYLAAQTDLPLPEKVVAQTTVDAAINQVEKVAQPPVPTPSAVPQTMGAINLLNPPNTTATATVPFNPGQIRHFGDSQIVPAVGQVPRG